MVAQAAAGSADDWWIIGSAAVALHCGRTEQVKDVDLLMSARDADRFLRCVGVEPRRGTRDDRFRSVVFGTWVQPPVSVEAFGGFEVVIDGMWCEVTLTTRESVTIGGAKVYVPKREELVRPLRAFGRPKDLNRAKLLSG